MIGGSVTGHGGEGEPALGRPLVEAFVSSEHRAFTGVPCSTLTSTFATIEHWGAVPSSVDITYVPAPREDAALALAAGLHLAGARCVVLMQNSGLGYCLNTITSFLQVYEIPVPMVIGWRGSVPAQDAVEHRLIGARLCPMLDAAGIPHVEFAATDPAGSVAAVLDLAATTGGPAALLVRHR